MKLKPSLGVFYTIWSQNRPGLPVQHLCIRQLLLTASRKVRMKKESKNIYIALFITLKALRHGSHSFTCKLHHVCLSFVSIHQMAPPWLRWQTSNCSLLLIYRPQKDEKLSWPGWLTYSGRFTHISGYPSAAGQAQDRKVRRPKTDVLPLCHVTTQKTILSLQNKQLDLAINKALPLDITHANTHLFSLVLFSDIDRLSVWATKSRNCQKMTFWYFLDRDALIIDG